MVIEVEKSRIKVLADSGPGESPLLGLQTVTFTLGREGPSSGLFLFLQGH